MTFEITLHSSQHFSGNEEGNSFPVIKSIYTYSLYYGFEIERKNDEHVTIPLYSIFNVNWKSICSSICISDNAIPASFFRQHQMLMKKHKCLT